MVPADLKLPIPDPKGVVMSATKRKSYYQVLITVTLLLATLLAVNIRGAMAQQGSGTGGLQVANALIDLQVKPGQVYVHRLGVSSGAEAPSMKITVEARGFGETERGEFLALPPEEDQSPYSARTFITSVSNPSFQLKPGESVPVDVTITVPNDIGTDTYYAMVYIHSEPISVGQGVANILAFSVPVVITPDGAQLNTIGKITSLAVDSVVAGKPIVIHTVVNNTGNRHYKIMGVAKISDPSGAMVTEIKLPLTTTSIIPTFSQVLKATYSAMDLTEPLQPGMYTADVQVFREDGGPIDQQQVQFEITKPFRPLPDIDDAHLLIACFEDEVPGVIDARSKTGIELSFEGVGKVTGCVAIGLYTGEPSGTPRLSDEMEKGGLAKTGVKYYAIQTQGFPQQGTAHLSMSYRANELGEVQPNSLFLANRNPGYWQKLANLDNQTGAEKIRGSMPVITLADGIVGALGGDRNSSWLPENLVTLILGALAVLILIGLVAFILKNRQRLSKPVRKPVKRK
jgi:hypothetical protein